jgi:DNA-binding MurR/RpiR family transcriptional regulator
MPKQIVDILNGRGLRTDRGMTWTADNFRRLHGEIDRIRETLPPEPLDRTISRLKNARKSNHFGEGLTEAIERQQPC